MDIIDIMVARALTPQGQIGSFAAQAQQAVAKANAAVSNLDSITEQTNANNEAATEAMAQATEALTKVDDALAAIDEAMKDIEIPADAIDGEIKKLAISMSSTSNSSVKATNLVVTYPDASVQTINNLIKYYASTGNNEDGTMTQKAITAAIKDAVANIKIEPGSGSGTTDGGSTNLGEDNAGNIVVIGDDGTIKTGEVTESEIIEALIKSGSYTAKNAVGLEIDYANKTFTRIQGAAGLTQGDDFDAYVMYGGRKRCNVADNGTITAFYGEAAFKDDGSNGQVMVYQPKFYYQRIPMTTANIISGKVVRRDSIMVSSTAQAGFKIHPLFVTESGEELDYVLLPAYEGSAYIAATASYDTQDSDTIDFAADKLSSVAGVKPISGVNKQFTVTAAEQMAQNRGTGWHITNMAAESALQLLELVEFGTLNGQSALEAGISNLPSNATANGASNTGSTAALGNKTGAASSTINITEGVTNTYSNAGRRAISYRGMENPWGNIWRFIGGINISGNNYQKGGVPYLCKNFNYSTDLTRDYATLTYYLTDKSDYISGFGYSSAAYDWVFLPVECENANSALPVGDYSWTSSALSHINGAIAGGSWYIEEKNGMFVYGLDQNIGFKSRVISARLMFIPTKNSIYEANIKKWRTLVGG